MALADALAQVLATRPGPRCTIAKLLDGIPPADRPDYIAALADENLSAVTICKAFAMEGHSVTRSPVERHRRGECACGSR